MSRFRLDMKENLRQIGLDITDVSPGRYVEIDLSHARKDPEEFAEYGKFDTLTVLNPEDLEGQDVFIYLNTPSPLGRYPIKNISMMKTIADRFYLQHREGMEGITLKMILGGDLEITPTSSGIGKITGEVAVNNLPMTSIDNIQNLLTSIKNNTLVGSDKEDILNALDLITLEIISLKEEIPNYSVILENIKDNMTKIDEVKQEIQNLNNEVKKGTIEEYLFKVGDEKPALSSQTRALGLEIDTSNNTQTVYFWNGSAWEVVNNED